MNTVTKRANCAVDIFRCVCAVLVVAIHTHPFMDVHPDLGFIFTNMITRIGVPFFLGVAGYFYCQKLESGTKTLIPYVKRLLFTYSLWTIFYYWLDFTSYGYRDISAYLKECIYYYFIAGSRGHFWFFPALIYTVCFITFLWKIGGKRLIIPLSIGVYLVGCLGSGYYAVGKQIPLLRNLFDWEHWQVVRRIFFVALPFFGGGYLVNRLQQYINKPRTTTILLIISTALWLGEVVMVKQLALQRDVATTPFLYLQLISVLLFLIHHPMSGYAQQAKCCRAVANFMYYVHPYVIIKINEQTSHALSETPLFVATVLLCAFGGLFLYKLDNKLLNKML